MKKIFFGIILISIFFIILINFFNENSQKELTIEYVEKGEGIKVLNEKEEVLWSINNKGEDLIIKR